MSVPTVIAPPPRRRRLAPLAAALAVLLSGPALAAAQEPSAIAPLPEEQALIVEVTPAIKGNAVRRLKALGTVAANNAVVVRPEIDGQVAKILFADGSAVKAGTPLVELDRALLQAELDGVRAALGLAQAEAERARELLARGAGTARARDEAEATLRSAQARLRLAQAELDKTRLDAPFDGVLGLRAISPGDYVAAGQALVNLEQLTPIKVEFRVPERFLPSLGTGMQVQVRSDSWPGEAFAATVRAIDPKIDRASRSVAVQAVAPNADLRLRPGQFATVELRLDERRDAVFVPERAVQPEGDEVVVYREQEGGYAVRVPIRPGLRIANHVEVLGGVKPGDRLVVLGPQRLQHGMRIRTVPAATPAPRLADEEIDVTSGS
ncbi:MAG TPA: efflux RND transporter periplasmic adaptor subunit [Alphaproteobacteria bacterium]|nr:efflux RND transporter periplasmic adaptor subunit [Alphaproteobacteria bacterium]